jgi:hypothetical protein
VFVLAVGIGNNGLNRNNLMNWEGGFTHYLTEEVLSSRPNHLDLKVVTIEDCFVPQHNPQHIQNDHLRSAITEWSYRQLNVEHPIQRTRVSITPRGLPQDGKYATSYPYTVGTAAALNQHPTEQDWQGWRNQPWVGPAVYDGANAWQSWSLHPLNIRLSVPSNIPISGWNNGPPCAENAFMAYMGTLLDEPNQEVTGVARSVFRALRDGKHFYFYNEWTFNTNAPATLFLRPGQQPPFRKHQGNTGHHLDAANGYLAAMLLVLDRCFANRVHYTYRTPGANYRNYNLDSASLMG